MSASLEGAILGRLHQSQWLGARTEPGRRRTGADQLHIWELGDAIELAAIVGIIGGVVLAAAAIALSIDRRRTVARLGWMLVLDGIVIVALLKGVRVCAGRRVDSPGCRRPCRGASPGPPRT